MAQNKNNIVIAGISGSIGKQLVFRQRDGKTFISKSPAGGLNRPPTPEQAEIRNRFQQAVVYGSAAIRDAATKGAYAAVAGPGQTAHNMAVADFFNAPDISEINLARYTGQPGSTISLKATDDFKVTAVQVRIENADGTLVEEGHAVAGADGLTWTYTAQRLNSDLTGDRITLTATDLPGNNTLVKETL
jgi:hypothetical protein